MIVLRFNPQSSLIRLRVVLEAEYSRDAILVFDTGALLTAITPQLTAALGCKSETFRDMSIYTASGVTQAQRLVLKSLSLYGEAIEAVEALCVPIPFGSEGGWFARPQLPSAFQDRTRLRDWYSLLRAHPPHPFLIRYAGLAETMTDCA